MDSLSAPRKHTLLLLGIILMSFLGSTEVARASVIIEQSDASSVVSGDFIISNPAQSIGSGIDGVFASLAIQHTCFNGFYELNIFEYDNADYSAYSKAYIPTSRKSGSHCPQDTWTARDFPQEIKFEPSKYYLFSFYQLDGRPYGSLSDDAYSGGQFFNRGTGGGYADDGTNVRDMYFILDLERALIGDQEQLRADNLTAIKEGRVASTTEMTFRATVTSPYENEVKLQVELRNNDEPFTGDFDGGILESDFVPSGSVVDISRAGLIDALYHWRARVIDREENTSNWHEFGRAGNVDFEVRTKSLPLPISQPIRDTAPHDFSVSNPAQSLGSGIDGTFKSFTFQHDCFRGTYSLFIFEYESANFAFPGEPSSFVRRHDASTTKDGGGVYGGPPGCFRVDTWVAGDFPTPVEFDPTKYYVLIFYQLDGAPYGSAFDDAYLNGQFFNRGAGGGYINENTNVRDIYFVLEVDPKLTPVVIVPGIMGTRLNRVSDGEEVWPDTLKMINPLTPSDDYLDELILDEQGQEVAGREMNPTQVIENERILLVENRIFYKNLIDSFKDRGYVPEVSLFTVSYDWRLDIVDELGRLDSAIRKGIANSPDGKIDIIAHSMGGLLVKEYLRRFENTDFVNKLILAGVPQLGAPKAFKLLNYGDDLGLRKWIFGLNPNKAKEISQNMPGVYEHLPSRRYLNLNPIFSPLGTEHSYVVDFRNGERRYLDYDETNQLMAEDPQYGRNAFLLGEADQFHHVLDTSLFNTSSSYNIVGCRNPDTIGSFRLYDRGKVKFDYTTGDGTIPLGSAINGSTLIPIQSTSTYFVLDPSVDHTDLVRDATIVEFMHDILNDEAGEPVSGFSNSNLDCSPRLTRPTRILFSTHSPVELHVYDVLGNHTGPVENGDFELAIPSSFYDKIFENSFVSVSAEGEYRVVVDALSKGYFDLEIRSLTGTEVAETITYLRIPIQSSSTVAEVMFTASEDEEGPILRLDNDGDGNFDKEIAPTAVLGAEESEDITPPVIILPDLSGNPPFTIKRSDFSVTDDISGVALVQLFLDELLLSGDGIVYIPAGEHILTIEAVDRAGNPAVEEMLFNLATPVVGLLNQQSASSTPTSTNKYALPIY